MSGSRVRAGQTYALALLLVLADAARLLGSIIGGFLALSLHRESFAPASERAGSILTTFGSAGDTAGALLVLAAAALVTWGLVGVTRLRLSVRVLVLATAVLVCLRLIGYFWVDVDFDAGGAVQDSVLAGFGMADLVLCLGAWLLLNGGRTEPAGNDSSESDPLVFAVDRGNGEVFAFFSYAEAARTISAYSIEDNEFDFYTDEGNVIEAVVVDESPQFAVTEQNRRDVLVSALTQFATKHDLDVASRDDLTCYAVPISDWQWLELWPRWMRGLGRLVNQLRR